MKQRFIIAKAGDANIWMFYKHTNTEGKAIYGNIKSAQQYPSRQRVLELIETLGHGIFKVEEVFVNE